jgi:hypothetical protein
MLVADLLLGPRQTLGNRRFGCEMRSRFR